MAISEGWDTRDRSLASWKSQGMDRILYSGSGMQMLPREVGSPGKKPGAGE